jgi:hypothetical protein
VVREDPLRSIERPYGAAGLGDGVIGGGLGVGAMELGGETVGSAIVKSIELCAITSSSSPPRGLYSMWKR